VLDQKPPRIIPGFSITGYLVVVTGALRHGKQHSNTDHYASCYFYSIAAQILLVVPHPGCAIVQQSGIQRLHCTRDSFPHGYGAAIAAAPGATHAWAVCAIHRSRPNSTHSHPVQEHDDCCWLISSLQASMALPHTLLLSPCLRCIWAASSFISCALLWRPLLLHPEAGSSLEPQKTYMLAYMAPFFITHLALPSRANRATKCFLLGSRGSSRGSSHNA
jgi:hypothetical protein